MENSPLEPTPSIMTPELPANIEVVIGRAQSIGSSIIQDLGIDAGVDAGVDYGVDDNVDDGVDDGVETELAAVVERYVSDGLPYAKSATSRNLATLPRLRPLVLRSGLTEKAISTSRAHNVEAMLGYTRGRVLFGDQACQECINKTRPFACCVIMDGMFQGSCAGCHYNSLGLKCSLRAGKNSINIMFEVDTKNQQ